MTGFQEMFVKFNIEPKNIDSLYVKQYLTIPYPISSRTFSV